VEVLVGQKNVLIIDDDIETQSLLKRFLSDKFCLWTAKNGKEGFEIAFKKVPDLILLDLFMPKIDGFEVCRLLRSNEMTRLVPIIIITAATDFEMRLKTFDLGTDDFLQKPFPLKELLARMNSILRRVEKDEKPPLVLCCGNLEIDLDRYECRIQGVPISLSAFGFKLLHYFMANFNRVLSREEILRDVWGGSIVSARAIDTQLVSLRKRIQTSNLIISSLYGAGYILELKTDRPSIGVADKATLDAKP